MFGVPYTLVYENAVICFVSLAKRLVATPYAPQVVDMAALLRQTQDKRRPWAMAVVQRVAQMVSQLWGAAARD